MAEHAPNYSLIELRIYWDKYWTISGHRYLIKGKWNYDFSGKVKRHIDATRAEVALLRNHMTFPDFVETYGKCIKATKKDLLRS